MFKASACITRRFSSVFDWDCHADWRNRLLLC